MIPDYSLDISKQSIIDKINNLFCFKKTYSSESIMNEDCYEYLQKTYWNKRPDKAQIIHYAFTVNLADFSKKDLLDLFNACKEFDIEAQYYAKKMYYGRKLKEINGDFSND